MKFKHPEQAMRAKFEGKLCCAYCPRFRSGSWCTHYPHYEDAPTVEVPTVTHTSNYTTGMSVVCENYQYSAIHWLESK